jgi:hypothetical protein
LGQRLQHQLAGLLAGIDVARADIGDPAGLGRVAVGREQGDLLADAIEGFARRLGIGGTHHDAGAPAATRSSISRI